uniref:Voltage-dependent calcium channel alpha-2/delta subunit conserved region domain-containing protein n=1 Tax=Hippocampus comes TaxID=109280 RepID=A0A3Q2Z7X3_HIPCM
MWGTKTYFLLPIVVSNQLCGVKCAQIVCLPRFVLDFNLCGLWHSDYLQKKVEALVPCETAYPGFTSDPSVKEANSIIKCGRCQKMFVVQQVPDSNLLVVVTEANCDCSRQYGAIPLEPKEIKYILLPNCNRMKSQKVRRRPESCHAYHPKVRLRLVGFDRQRSRNTFLCVIDLSHYLACRKCFPKI